MSEESDKPLADAATIPLDHYALQRLERLENQTRRLNDELKIEAEFSKRIETEHTNLAKQLENMIEQEMNREKTWLKNVELAEKLDKIAKAENVSETSNQTPVKKKTKTKVKVKKPKEGN